MQDDDELDLSNMKRAFTLIEALYHEMPPREYFDNHLSEIMEEMGPQALDFLAAVSAVTTVALRVMTDEQRAKFFALGEGIEKFFGEEDA